MLNPVLSPDIAQLVMTYLGLCRMAGRQSRGPKAVLTKL